MTMKRLKKSALFALAAIAVTATVAFTQAKSKFDSAALEIGASAPDYSLPDQDGLIHTLSDDEGKVVLLAFYPADFTGGCTLEAHSLSSADKDLKAEGVTVYGVSVQDPKSHKSFCSKEGIPYTLLADTEKKMAAAYGVLIPGIGIANRVTFIIGTDGKVAFVDKNVNGHLTSCGQDWVAWIKAHPQIKGHATQLRQWRSAENLYTFPIRNLPPKEPVAIGKGAYDFNLRDAITGSNIELTNLAQGKKATVIMFISTRCPVSNAYNERMVALAKRYVPKGVAFVGIDANSTEATPEIAAFAKEHGFLFPVLKDEGSKVADMYNARVTPETYVVNSAGILVYHGRIDNDMDPTNVKTHELATALDSTLAGKPVARPEAKAFGCSIKR